MRLSSGNLGALPDYVVRPGYDRDARDIGIVHFGIGAFHKAHMADYTDDALAAEGGDWRILGVSMRSAGVSHQMHSQDGLYKLAVRSGEANKGADRRLSR